MPVYAVDKPLKFTSHDVVNRARRLLGTRRVGHTGTLDPLASGVLVLCSESSTKLVQFMESDSKDYLAWISLGAATPTLDAEGPVTQTAFVTSPEVAQVEATLGELVGHQQQIPPQYSALQVGGQRAYAVARAGGALELPARNVVIHELRLLGVYSSLAAVPTRFAPGEDGVWAPAESGRAFPLPAALGEFPTLVVWARVGSGTYLRSLARDIGERLGMPAHLSGLARTRVGQFRLQDACTLEELPNTAGLGDLGALALPRLALDAHTARDLRDGKRPDTALEGRFAAVLQDELVAVVDADGQQLRVVRAWH